MPGVDDLKQKIDTNNSKVMEPQEIINFSKNDKNVQELGEILSCPTNLLDQQSNKIFIDAVYNATLNNYEFQSQIGKKIKGYERLTDFEVFLLYLQSLVDPNCYPKPSISKSGDVYARYGGFTLLRYIRGRYFNNLYNFNPQPIPTSPKTTPKKELVDSRPYEIAHKTGVSLPSDIDLSNFGENDFLPPRYFDRLDNWAEVNFPSEYEQAKRASQKRNTEKRDKKDGYVKYDLIIFSLKKYISVVEEKHLGIVKSIYGTEENYRQQQELVGEYFEKLDEISNNPEFSDIETIINKIEQYSKDLERLQQQYLKNENEEEAQKRYEKYMAEVDQKGKDMGIDDMNDSFSEEVNTSSEATKFFENMNKVLLFEQEKTEIKSKYGDSIDNYENFMFEKGELIKKYGKDNIQNWAEKCKKYGEMVNKYENYYKNRGLDLEKYKKYERELRIQNIDGLYKNIEILKNNLSVEKEGFPIDAIKQDFEYKKRQQAETDERWTNLKKKNAFLYQVCNIGSRSLNALVSSTRGTGAKLGAIITSFWHDDDEMVAVWERVGNGVWNPHFNMSTKQLQSVYENGKINFNWDNGPGVIAESIVNMLVLVAGGGAISKGLTKGATKIGIGISTKGLKTLGKVGLFTSGFMQQVGPSFQEGLNAGMTGNQALLYTMLSAGIQGGLELISPNEIILGSGSGLAKSYIKEILKTETKESFKAIGKLFLKNVGSEILGENVQEVLQLTAGNLINMWANDQFDLGEIIGTESLESDWNPENFLATVLVTTITTGIVTGGSFTIQTPGIGNTQNREQLIEYIQNNAELRSDVMNVLDNTINLKTKIPNVDINQLEELKGILNNTKNENSYLDGKPPKVLGKNEQSLSIHDTQEQEGLLGEPTLGQLKDYNNTINDNTIGDYRENLDTIEEKQQFLRDVFYIDSLTQQEIEAFRKEEIVVLKQLKDLGISVSLGKISIELSKLTSEQIDKLKELKGLGIDISNSTISYSRITLQQIENLKRIKDELGIDIGRRNIEQLKDLELTSEQIDKLKELKGLGIDILLTTVEELSKLTSEQIDKLKELKGLGIDISNGTISYSRITLQQIENLKRIKDELGIDINLWNIEQLKDLELTSEQVDKLKELKGLGIDILYNTEDLLNLTTEEILRIIDLKGKIVNFDIKIPQYLKLSAEEKNVLDGLLDLGIKIENFTGFDANTGEPILQKIGNKGIQQLQHLQSIGVDISGFWFHNLVSICDIMSHINIDKIKQLKDLGIKIDDKMLIDLGKYTESDINTIINININKMKQLKKIGIEIDYKMLMLLQKYTESDIETMIDENINKINKLRKIGIKIDDKMLIDLGKYTESDIDKISNIIENKLNEINNKILNKEREVKKIENKLSNHDNNEDSKLIEDLRKTLKYKEIELETLKSIQESVYKIFENTDMVQIDEISQFMSEILPSGNEIRDYNKRKNEYLERYQMLENSDFNQLFKVEGSEAKYGMSEINQKSLGYCYAYTGFELLKKSNFFETLIKTSMKKTSTGREVMFPLGDPNGHILKISNKEIDSKYDFSEIDKNEPPDEARGIVSINSDTSLGFKVLEIAFIKEYIINNKKYNGIDVIEKSREEYKNTGDITINEYLLHEIEGGFTTDFFKHLLPKDVIKTKSIENIEMKKVISKFVNIGNTKVNLGIRNNTGLKFIECETIDGKKMKVYTNHAYSIEKVYHDDIKNTDIIEFINPWDTKIKYKITVDEACNIFNIRDITSINIGKMFQ